MQAADRALDWRGQLDLVAVQRGDVGVLGAGPGVEVGVREPRDALDGGEKRRRGPGRETGGERGHERRRVWLRHVAAPGHQRGVVAGDQRRAVGRERDPARQQGGLVLADPLAVGQRPHEDAAAAQPCGDAGAVGRRAHGPHPVVGLQRVLALPAWGPDPRAGRGRARRSCARRPRPTPPGTRPASRARCCPRSPGAASRSARWLSARARCRRRRPRPSSRGRCTRASRGMRRRRSRRRARRDRRRACRGTRCRRTAPPRGPLTLRPPRPDCPRWRAKAPSSPSARA